MTGRALDTLTHCLRCGARYQAGLDWVRVRYKPGTSGACDVVGAIQADHCPICRKPPLLVDSGDN